MWPRHAGRPGISSIRRTTSRPRRRSSNARRQPAARRSPSPWTFPLDGTPSRPPAWRAPTTAIAGRGRHRPPAHLGPRHVWSAGSRTCPRHHQRRIASGHGRVRHDDAEGDHTRKHHRHWPPRVATSAWPGGAVVLIIHPPRRTHRPCMILVIGSIENGPDFPRKREEPDPGPG